MKEDFLHYVWQFQKITTDDLRTTDGELLQIKNVGQHNKNAGPDFFNAQVHIGDQLWAGTVEIHIKSSDWYAHHHEIDAAYDNVILHVVWEHDTNIYRKDNSVIPTLVLKKVVTTKILKKYDTLFATEKQFIHCEKILPEVDPFILENWKERLYIERLEQKNLLINKLLAQSNNDWEAVLFQLLSKNFGLKVNEASFLSIAHTIDFSTIRKTAHDAIAIEALLLGQAGILNDEKEELYYKKLKKEYEYLKLKHSLSTISIITPKFFRLRPPNFPTIRLSQLGQLYHRQKQLFQAIIKERSLKSFYELFSIAAADYWNTHYNFGVVSGNRAKKTTKSFIDLLLINTIIPIKYAYSNYIGDQISEEILTLIKQVTKEENTIIKKYNAIYPLAGNAMDSQALLQLKNNYCNTHKCLQCAIGNAILKR